MPSPSNLPPSANPAAQALRLLHERDPRLARMAKTLWRFCHLPCQRTEHSLQIDCLGALAGDGQPQILPDSADEMVYNLEATIRKPPTADLRAVKPLGTIRTDGTLILPEQDDVVPETPAEESFLN